MPEMKIDTEIVAQLATSIGTYCLLPGTVLHDQAVPVFLGIVVKGVIEASNPVTGVSRLLTRGSYFGGPPRFQTDDVLFRTLTFAEIHLLDYNRVVRPLRRSPNLHSQLSDRLRQRLPPDVESLKGTAIHDPRFGTYKGRVEHDDLAPILAVTNCMSRDDLESVLVMVESLIKRRQIRDGVTDAVYDLLMTPKDGGANPSPA